MYNKLKIEEWYKQSLTDKLMNELTENQLERIMNSHLKLWKKYELLEKKLKRYAARIDVAVAALEQIKELK